MLSTRLLVAGCQTISWGAGPRRGRSGKRRPSLCRYRTTPFATRNSRNLANTRCSRLWTSSSGQRMIWPSRVQDSPAGSARRNSPRSALCHSPVFMGSFRGGTPPLAHHPGQTQKETIVVGSGVVEALTVGDERPEEGAELKELA